MRALVASLIVLVLAACGTAGETRSDSVARNREIVEATAVWVAAYNSRDPSRIAALYDHEAVFWGTTSATIRATPATIADYFKDAAKRPDARVTVTDQFVRVVGEMAVNTGSYTFTDVRESKNVSNPSRFTFVFQYRDGRWHIASHHSSRVPAQQ
jgi:uncharacterized protein (TIGR02246 family)